MRTGADAALQNLFTACILSYALLFCGRNDSSVNILEEKEKRSKRLLKISTTHQ